MQLKQFIRDKRALLPLLVIDLDGAIGFWDEQKNYNIHPNMAQYM